MRGLRPVVLAAALSGFAWIGAVAAAEFTDSAGRAVSVPDSVARLLPAGPPADVLLYALAPDALVGMVEPWTAERRPAVPGRFQDQAKVPRVTGKPGDADIAALKALKPDLIVDYGDVNPDYAGLADRMQATIGAPYVLLDGRLSSAPAVLRRLGTAVRRGGRGEETAAAVEKALAVLAPLATLAFERRVPIYYARGRDGLQAIRSGSSLDEGMALAGARNVTASGRGAMTATTLDDVARLGPKVVVVADPRAAAPDSPLRKALPAGTRFFVDRGAPFPWIENPPSLNRLVGAFALAGLLYPEMVPDGAAQANGLARVLFAEAPSVVGLVEAPPSGRP